MTELGDQKQEPTKEEIAIIGMAGRFPGAKNIAQFWNNLRDGVESVKTLTDEELRGAGVDDATFNDPAYVRCGAVLDDADSFDADFFGITPREAQIMDPQHRILLECAWEALEHAGYDSTTYDGPVGVFGGIAPNTYYKNNLITRPEILQAVGSYPAMIATEKEYSITRISFKLDLKGPGIFLNTACSTSGVAIHFACQSVLSGECDMALAGGCRIQVPLRSGYLYQEDGILSPDGHCRAFSRNARGTVVGSGAAMIVLKSYSDALKDNDTIYAIIKGTAINNDGAEKIGFTAPSVKGQARLIHEALAVAEVDPENISYIEAHGTGTSLGDPIEIAALTQAYRQYTSLRNYCAIGSVKTNIGHLDAAAGVAGVIKTVLAMQHRQIPASLNFAGPNPQIDFDNSPFYVNDELAEWPDDKYPRHAGVSSFGLGGTNAHIILGEAPASLSSQSNRPWQLLTFSAKKEDALQRITANLAAHLRNNPEIALADAAFTLQQGRRTFRHRRMLVCSDIADAVALLETPDSKQVFTNIQEEKERSIVFMFSGQGSQYVHMGKEIYQTEKVFRETLDACSEILKPYMGIDIRHVIYPHASQTNEAAEQLSQTRITQPILFVIEYALAKLWMKWGIVPQAMIGHSIGEYVAACLAEVFSLENALALVAARGKLMQQLPRGAMLALPMTESEAAMHLGEELSLATINSNAQCVVSGPVEAIKLLNDHLTKQGIQCRRVLTSHAFHSQMMEPVLDEFTAVMEKLKLHPPTRRYISNVTGTWITDGEATSPEYWARHIRNTVRFADGVQVLLQDMKPIFLEVGAGQTLGSFVRRTATDVRGKTIYASLPHPKEKTSDLAFILTSLGRLWLSGTQLSWSQFYEGEDRRRIALPTYPFARKRYWVEMTKSVHSGEKNRTVPIDDREPENISMNTVNTNETVTTNRTEKISLELKNLLEDISGIPPEELDDNATFLELGFDSLLLTQANTAIKKKFEISFSFRQLFEETPNIQSLSEYLHTQLPPDMFQDEKPYAPAHHPSIVEAPQTNWAQQAPPAIDLQANMLPGNTHAQIDPGRLEKLIMMQIQSGNQLLEILRNQNKLPDNARSHPVYEAQLPSPAEEKTDHWNRALTPRVSSESPSGLGPWKPVQKTRQRLSVTQQQNLDNLIRRFNTRTSESKRLTQLYRAKLADPRTAAGFQRPWKELVYPIFSTKSAGSKIWDVDGNEWLDITMGFGVSLFGHSPPFIIEAIEKQLKESMATGPQTVLAGKIAELICELTGMERIAFCNTGSEAVLAAIRTARAVTGKTRIAVFADAYHGIFDEVLIRKIVTKGQIRPVPVASGIPHKAVEDVLVLDYGDFRGLDTIRRYSDELAAILVEPIQSRNPEIQPREFLHALRDMTVELEIPLIFDEMITGFRLNIGGAQAHFGVKADIAAYGKIVGGGMPIGIVAGKAQYLDALDGGMWNFDDDSVPEAGTTWFAGTFVRHPLTLAAAYAALKRLKDEGTRLLENVNAKTSRFVEDVNHYFKINAMPIRVAHFGTLFLIRFTAPLEFSGLYWHYLRDHGIHCHEGRPNYLTTAHTEDDVEVLLKAFKKAAEEMRAAGFLPAASGPEETPDEQKGTAKNLLSVDSSAGGNEAEVKNIPLTGSQLEIWLATCLSVEASCAFNVSTLVHLEGQFRVDLFCKALNQVCNRHEALRTTISENGDYQRIVRDIDIQVPVIDLSGYKAKTRQEKITSIKRGEVDQPFDLTEGPLLRAKIIIVSKHYHIMLFTAHHIICDGWSLEIIMQDLSTCYSMLAGTEDIELKESIQYGDFVDWLQELHSSAEGAETKQFWLSQFSSIIPVLDLPTDRPHPPVKTYPCNQQSLIIDSQRLNKIEHLAKEHKCTMFSVLLSIYHILIMRLSDQDDFVVGLAAGGQSSLGSKKLVGHCVNLLPIRSSINPDLDYPEYLVSVRNSLLDAFEHQHYSFGALIQELNIPRDQSRVPLISTIITYESAAKGIHFPGLHVTLEGNPRSHCIFDLEFYIRETRDELIIRFDFNSDLFDSDTVRRWLENYETILGGIIANPNRQVGRLPILTDKEFSQLMSWNETGMDFPRDTCLHRQFEKQADLTPDSVAVISESREITYGELNKRANRLAQHIIPSGVGPDSIVGIFLERSVEMIAAILGILKAGGAYLPLDPEYPKDRIDFMLSDSQAKVLITQHDFKDFLPSTCPEIIFLDTDNDTNLEDNDNPTTNVTSDNLAYLLYTSGSTGLPKGVAIEHHSPMALLSWAHTVFTDEELEGVLFSTSICFDLSVFEIFVPLTRGGKVIISNNLLELPSLESAREVTLINTVPSAIAELVRMGGVPPSVSTINLAGELLKSSLVEKIYEVRSVKKVYDLYGPSEDTTYSTCVLRSVDGPQTIGRPISNTQAYIFDKQNQLAPIGAIGELYLGGEGLARGYLNRPELTAEKFIPNPFDSTRSARIYATGDLTRYLSDGQLVYIGRIDHQVKIRGYRIELGEVDSVLSRHPSIKEQVVISYEFKPDDIRIIAYIVLSNKDTSVAQLRDHLAAKLPGYMIPSLFIELDALPLTPNGKIDRKALPAPDSFEHESIAGYVEPEGEIEQAVARIWQDVLGLKTVGANDDFFLIGGHSLLATQVLTRLNDFFQIKLTLNRIFETPTVSRLAYLIETILIDEIDLLSDEDAEKLLIDEETGDA